MQVPIRPRYLRHAGLLLISSAFLLSACSTTVHQNGESKDVDVKTPIGTVRVKNSGTGEANKSVDINTFFGGVHVHTNDVDPKDVGLNIYPGARLAPRSEDNDSQANVNISTAWFGLRVVALKYESDDAPEKLLDYYKKDLGRYGNVLQCRNGKQVGGTPATAPEDPDKLSCSEHHSGHNGPDINIGDHEKNTMELKAGSMDRERIVAISPSGSGSRFELVYVQKRDSHETM